MQLATLLSLCAVLYSQPLCSLRQSRQLSLSLEHRSVLPKYNCAVSHRYLQLEDHTHTHAPQRDSERHSLGSSIHTPIRIVKPGHITDTYTQRQPRTKHTHTHTRLQRERVREREKNKVGKATSYETHTHTSTSAGEKKRKKKKR
jgi:hypothetical protein